MAKWTSFTPTPFYFALKVLNPYCESVAWLKQKNWMEYRQYFGREPIVINDPYTNQLIGYFKIMTLGHLLLLSFFPQIDNLFPADRLLQFVQMHSFIFSKVVRKDPIKSAILEGWRGGSEVKSTDCSS